jgi:cell wall-associated NlpC family hydrolase
LVGQIQDSPSPIAAYKKWVGGVLLAANLLLPAANADDVPTVPAGTESNPDAYRLELDNYALAGAQIVDRAMQYLGTPYRWGGTKPTTGFDCSGFVRYVMLEALAVANFPRTPAEMIHQGERITKDALQPGDLLFFNTGRGKYSHVGIYVGDGNFIHAPHHGIPVSLTALDSQYYQHRLTYAVRVPQIFGVQNR